jgi:hypothetical protein
MQYNDIAIEGVGVVLRICYVLGSNLVLEIGGPYFFVFILSCLVQVSG